MSQSSDVDRRPTSILVGAGDIMRTLSVPRLTTLHYVHNNASYTQQEIADILGYSRSPISTYLTTMAEDLPVALVTKQGQRYTVTEAGKTVLSDVRKMLGERGVDLDTVDWTDETDTEEVADCLAPFGNARSAAPILLLYSIGTRGTIGDRIESLGTSLPVQLQDTVHDVEARLSERGESTTRKQVQHLLRRFEDANTIEYGDQIILTEKGHEQANLLEQFIQLLESHPELSSDEAEREDTVPSQSSLIDAHSPEQDTQRTTAQRSETPQMQNIAQQVDPRGFFDRGRASIDMVEEPAHDSPTIIPVYCLRSAGSDANSVNESDSQMEPVPLLPLTALPLDELASHVDQLASKFDDDVEVEPYWALQTETGLHPLSPACLPIAEASQRAWKLVNDAQELWNDQSR